MDVWQQQVVDFTSKDLLLLQILAGKVNIKLLSVHLYSVKIHQGLIHLMLEVDTRALAGMSRHSCHLYCVLTLRLSL